MRNLHRGSVDLIVTTEDKSTVEICGLLRIYELYTKTYRLSLNVEWILQILRPKIETSCEWSPQEVQKFVRSRRLGGSEVSPILKRGKQRAKNGSS